ncbi:MAG TPA: SdrD B-like domain-containing protein [Anaerolineales bacterium]
MKHLLVSVLVIAFLTACGESDPLFTDNGNPGHIKAVVFFDENQNGIMDGGEKGAPSIRLALGDQVGCTSSTGSLSFIPTDSNGVVNFNDLKPGLYCVGIDNGYKTTTKLNLDAYVSSDMVTTVMFGVIREP